MQQRIRRSLLVTLMAISTPAFAHPSLSRLVQHDIILEADAVYLDVTVRITFQGDEARHVFSSLDNDGNGELSGAERQAGHALLTRYAERGFTMRADGKPLTLIPRFDVDITVSASNGEEPSQVTFVLALFARRPPSTNATTKLTLHDSLFPELPAMVALHVAGNEGVRLSADGAGRGHARAAATPFVMTATLYAPKPGDNP